MRQNSSPLSKATNIRKGGSGIPITLLSMWLTPISLCKLLQLKRHESVTRSEALQPLALRAGQDILTLSFLPNTKQVSNKFTNNEHHKTLPVILCNC